MKQTVANGKRILDEVIETCRYGWAEVEDALAEHVDTYDKMGELLAALMAWNGGQGDLDSDIAELLAKLVRAYWREQD